MTNNSQSSNEWQTFFDATNKNKHYQAIKISLASPETILSWSHGEVLKAETINYKSLKPEKDGLFDERIFGPIKNYECACGRYKKIKNRGKICERCGVEVVESIVRRERLGHIQLEEPVAHIWLLKAPPSRLTLALNMKAKEVEEIIYFVSYVVLDGGTTKRLKPRMVMDLSSAKSSKKTREQLILTLKEIMEKLTADSVNYLRAQTMIDELQDIAIPFSMDECAQFINKHTGAEFGIGAAAIEKLLSAINLEKEIVAIKKKLAIKRSQIEKRRLIRRLKVLSAFYHSGNKLEWMILHVLPVIPPDIRPIIQLDGGRFTASEINDLYRRIIIRNDRLRKVKEMGAPSVIIHNEMRMLQEAVDALIDNDRKARPVTGRDKRPLKSLTSTIKGKQGRFRQNLLGKRVDYSGRSVIAVGPYLKMYQCGLPQEMALILFKPFIIARLIEYGLANNVKLAEKMIYNRVDRVWDVLKEVIRERPVLLNRAPTLHRLGIQAFEPVLVRGKAIRLHPLATTAFNADFDGDQMAVHVPLTPEAVAEARALMLGSQHILGSKDGLPIVTPTQDMVLGNYYLTMEEAKMPGEGTIFANFNEAYLAYRTQKVHLHALIGISVKALASSKLPTNVHLNGVLITTIGKLIFNNIFPDRFPYINQVPDNSSDLPQLIKATKADIVPLDEHFKTAIKKRALIPPFKKKTIAAVIMAFFNHSGAVATSQMLDRLKNLGFRYSMISGTTVSAGDASAYNQKYSLFAEADKFVHQINAFYEQGLLTNEERHQQIITRWADVKQQIQSEIDTVLKRDPKNPIFMMADSGARGNISNFTQLVGMRGLMNNPSGEVIELPIRSSFREGLSVLEFFISTHGARKGTADMALKTADSGYLTRRLVDVAQDVFITQDDCHATHGFMVHDIIDTKQKNVIVPLHDRIIGRFLKTAAIDNDGNVIVPADTLVTNELAAKVVAAGIDAVEIYSVLTCEANYGICQKCFGTNLATRELIEMGTAVGIIAAQSIGEPGTQLTMWTFHTGGVAEGNDITQGLPRVKELVDVTNPRGMLALIAEITGKVSKIVERDGIYTITITNDKEERVYKSQYNTLLRIKRGDKVFPGQKLTEGAINIRHLLDVAGLVPVQRYILKEIQRVYRLQGIEISDKYIELIIRQMLNRVNIIDPGDSPFLAGQIIPINQFKLANGELLLTQKRPIVAKPVIFGIKKAPLESSSFLAAASFQDTTRVLTKAIVSRAVDHLQGLKENVILGNLIPAGTGLWDRTKILEAGEAALKTEY